MKQTAVEWLLSELEKYNHPTEAMILYAKKLEQDQMEVPNEEIEKASYDQATFTPSFIAGAKWYRKQIKK